MFEKKNRNNCKEGGRVLRADVCLLLLVLLLASGSFVWFAVRRPDGRSVRISCDGRRITSAPLSQKAEGNTGTLRYCLIVCGEDVSCRWYETRPDLTSVVPEGSGYNLLVISESRVFMESADCRDQICVHHRPITGGGESIICLPHKLVVEIVGGTDSDISDGIVRADDTNTGRKEGRRSHEADG